MVKTMEMGNHQKPICFAETRVRSHSLWGWDDDSYCIWSCRFSADGNEVRSTFRTSPSGKLIFDRLLQEDGGRSSVNSNPSDCACLQSPNLHLIVYDLIADRRTVKISAHEDDVNSCCWADSGSNVLISASDDTYLKVWYGFVSISL